MPALRPSVVVKAISFRRTLRWLSWRDAGAGDCRRSGAAPERARHGDGGGSAGPHGGGGGARDPTGRDERQSAGREGGLYEREAAWCEGGALGLRRVDWPDGEVIGSLGLGGARLG